MEAKQMQQTKLIGVKHNQCKSDNVEEVDENSVYFPNGMSKILGLNDSVSSNAETDYIKFVVEKTN